MAGGKVLLSEGQLYSAAPIVIDRDNVNIVGAGLRATTLRKPGGGGSTHTFFELLGTDRTADRIRYGRFEGFQIFGDGKTGRAFDAKYVDFLIMRDIYIRNVLDNVIYAEECWMWQNRNVHFSNCGAAPGTLSVVVYYNGDDDNTNDWTWNGCRWENNFWTELESDAGGGGASDNSKMRYTDCKFERLTGNTIDVPMVTGPHSTSSWINPLFWACRHAAIVLPDDGDNNEFIGGYYSNLCTNPAAAEGRRSDIELASDRNRIIGVYFEATGADQHVYLAATSESNTVGLLTQWDATPKLPVLDLGRYNRIDGNASNTHILAATERGVVEGWVLDDDQDPTLGYLPVNAIVTEVSVWVEEAFDAGGADDSLTVGYGGNTNAYVTTGLNMRTGGLRELITEAHGNAGATLGTVDATVRQVRAYLTHTGAEPTAGKVHITLHYIVATAEPA